MFRPMRFAGSPDAVQSMPNSPVGNRMPPSSTALTMNDPGSWKPGQDQNMGNLRGQQKTRDPIVRPKAPFVLR